MPLVALADVKTALNIEGSGEDARLNLLITSVSQEIETYCRRVFSSTSNIIELHDGDDKSILLLDRWPVTAINTVHVSEDLPRVYGADELLTDGEDYILDLTTGVLHRVDGSIWPAGPQTVRVDYDAGYGTVPEDVQRAAIELIQVKHSKGKGKQYHLTSESHVDGGVSGIRFDDVSIDTMRVLNHYRDARVFR